MNTEYVTLDASRTSARNKYGNRHPELPEAKINLEDLAFDIRRAPITPTALKEFIEYIKG